MEAEDRQWGETVENANEKLPLPTMYPPPFSLLLRESYYDPNPKWKTLFFSPHPLSETETDRFFSSTFSLSVLGFNECSWRVNRACPLFSSTSIAGVSTPPPSPLSRVWHNNAKSTPAKLSSTFNSFSLSTMVFLFQFKCLLEQ